MTEFTEHAGEIDSDAIDALSLLVQRCFDPEPSIDFEESVRAKHRPAAIIAWDDRRPIGFKLGYEHRPETFYSWLGGVDEDFKRRGRRPGQAPVPLHRRWIAGDDVPTGLRTGPLRDARNRRAPRDLPGHGRDAAQPCVHNHVVEVDGDRARGFCSVEIRLVQDGAAYTDAGHYEDTFRREADGWKFELRKLVLYHWVPHTEGWGA